MADPTVQSFCCRRPPRTQQHLLLLAATDTLIHEFSSRPYLITTLISASLGMVGALYQIIIRYWMHRDQDFRLYYLQTMRYFRVPKRLLAQNVGKKIIVWLAVADFFASGGVFIRATFWMYVRPSGSTNGINVIPENTRVVFCAVISGLIQYFYTCTWLWTLCYAFNVRTYLKDELVEEKKYHAFVWPTAAILTALGTTVLYYPNADCHNFADMFTALTRVLPNYFATYLPIIMVMLINPVVYHSASNDIDMDMATGTLQCTTTERNINTLLKWKFLLINVVFYICWLPNLICGVTLWTAWHDLPEKFTVVMFYLMAIVNPLQAFFNALVYRKWQPQLSTASVTNPIVHQTILQRAFQRDRAMNERTPLLQQPVGVAGGGSMKSPTAPPFHQL